MATSALPRKPGGGTFDHSTSKPRVKQKEVMEFVKAIDAHIAEKYKDICARSVILAGLDMEKTMTASDGGSGDPSALVNGIEETYSHLMRKAQGIYAEAGVREVVLGPELAGILAHEAIGHTVEADLVLGGSVAGENVGRKVAADMVTLVDYAHTANGKVCPVPVHVDDEGTEARDVVLIENGVLKNFMHNKETAAHFGVEPMGNARAHEFSDEPLVRMRNTATNPGTSSLEDMISDVKDGYYLIRPSNGQADSNSEFMFGVVIGYEIKKGKIGRAIRDVTISGVAFDMLKTVTALSDDMAWLSGGMCGKKQLIPVGMGGPAVRCRIMIGGRR